MIPPLADQARAILHQFNDLDFPDYKFQGPHFVTHYHGDFMMRPYGLAAKYRYSFHVTPDYDFGRLEEPFWIFNVL
jgi:hypothetical protein